METGVSVTRLEPDSPDRFVPLRRRLGVTAFGLNQLVLRSGERGRIHRHERQEEVYLVLRGTLTLELEGEARDLAEGELARVGPEVRRRLLNRGPDPCVLLAVGAAGEHAGRDGLAYADWDDDDPRPPQEVPLPDDLPASELRAG
ncbi:MAG TPA: cupin domain-containing protein [Miltoncostaeaceae bacterium]|nr:cupin domain-containing protein [Miltoncostaeaceae bacterium]